MIYFLLFISFLIHVVTFIVIKQLKDKYTKLQTIEANVEQRANELEDTLAVYLLDLKEENEKFINQLDHVEKNKKEQENKNEPVHKKKRDKEENTPPVFSTIESTEQVNDTVEKSLTSHVLHLSEKGYTVEEIAKKLDKGKTEIELLLKVYQNK